MNGLDLVIIGIIMVFIGFIVVVLSIISSTWRGRVEGGGIIIIGPIPIVFGSNKNITSILLILAIILTILSIILFITPMISYRGVP